jgi:eukaryotic-like serine/threonine-protein kinase
VPVTDRLTVVAGLHLVRLVGRGGEGDVWEARAADGGRRAVKLVRPEAVAAPEQIAVRGDWLRRIDHPALVRVRRTGLLAEPALRGWGLVEMDFVDGHDLSAAGPGFQAIARLRPLAEGLDRLHDGAWSDGTPLVHRDIKPANLIAAPDGRVVLVDCSSLCGVDRSLLTRIGTPLFAAPEVITGRIGPAADVYSFAATVVALVSGARGDALAAYLADPWRVHVPDPVRLALAADPGSRPRRCGVLLDPEIVRLEERWLPSELGGLDEDSPPATTALVPDEEASDDPPRPPGMRGVGPADAEPVLVPAPPPRTVWPFLALLGVAGAFVCGAVLDPVQLGRPWLVTAAIVSLIAHLGAGRRISAVIVVPTVAWAGLLAERATVETVRRSWTRTTLTGVLTSAAALAWQAIVQAGATASARLLVVTIVVAFLLTAAVVGTARASQRTIAMRLVLLPATVLGAAVLLAGAVLAAPFKLVSGRPEDAAWPAGDALRGLRGVVLFGANGEPGARDGADDTGADDQDPDRTEIDQDWSVA